MGAAGRGESLLGKPTAATGSFLQQEGCPHSQDSQELLGGTEKEALDGQWFEVNKARTSGIADKERKMTVTDSSATLADEVEDLR